MSKIYNTQEEIASKIKKFLLNIYPDIRKTQLKIIPYIIIGMFLSESLVASDISKKLKDDFSLVQHASVVKRIRRLFKNKLFNPYLLYDKIIRFVISNYSKKHNDKRVHIIFDHMFSHDNYTVFMITLRVGKQGVPLWFRCFPGSSEPSAFKEDLLKEGILYVSSLFSSDFDLIFLADRWFNSFSLLNYISSLGHTYCVRLKGNIRVLVYDNKEKHYIWKTIDSLQAFKYKSSFYENVKITNDEYVSNIVVSKYDGVKEPWVIVTNGDPRRAIKDYGYRFGGIEAVFKSQKSNGFYLESTVNASLKYFESMYCMASIGILFLTILGADYSKNTRCYKDIKITTHHSKSKQSRTLSLFNLGLTLFNLAFNSIKYIRLPIRFILYDI